MPTSPFVFDPFTAETQRDPFPLYEVLRRDFPLYRDEKNGLWVLSRYGDVRAVIMDPETYSSAGGIVQGQNLENFAPILSAIDPPQHTRMRKAANPWFTPRQVAFEEARVRGIVQKVLAGLDGRDTADLVHDVAEHVPILTIADLCGIPLEDLDRFQSWLGSAISEGLDSDAGQLAFTKITEYFDGVVTERTATPGDDLISRVINTEVDGQRLPRIEKVGLALVTFIGGIEATTFHLSNVFAQLGRHLDFRRELVENPGLIPTGTEEILRYDSSVQADLRTLTTEVQLYGEKLAAGDQVMVLMGSANRDPEVFEDPDRIDVRRSPNPHLGFMVGIHFCIGASLARLESKVVVEEVLARYPEYTLADPEIPRTFTNRAFMRGVTSLPVALR
jgi:cytochrome P450